MANDVNIHGDAARQAISSLKGYAYQLYESALAWVSLVEDESLFLEVAEDYAVATADAINAVQVKDKIAPITLNSKEVADTINSLFYLSKKNPGKKVSIRHLTTAKIGLERNIKDRVSGTSGLEYWISAQAGADVEPLRQRMLGLSLSNEAIQFLRTSSSQQIAEGLIKRIEWLTGEKDLETLRQALSNRLVYLGEKKGVASSICDAMVDPLVSKVLSLACSKGSPCLVRADFIRFFDEASRVSLPVSAVETMISAINPAWAAPSYGFIASVAVLRPVAAVEPTKFAMRTGLVRSVQRAINQQRFAWLFGATGTGKSSLSKLIAHEAGSGWYSLQLRSMDARETAVSLFRASSQIAIEKPKGVVLDDLGPLVSSLPKEAFSNLVETARRTSTSLIVTANLEPSTAVLDVVNTPASAAIKVGNLTEEEIAAFILMNGGSPDRWARYVYRATGGGHPLLVDGLVRGLRAQKWPMQELQELSGILGSNRDIEEVKSEVRQRLFQELQGDESNLLMRLSLVLGTFDRKMAMFLGELEPAAQLPGRAFDNLVGAWIEAESEDRFRLSSLVGNVGGHTLGSKEIEKIHHTLAEYYTKDRRLNADRIDDIVLHGMVGKNDRALAAVSMAIIGSKPDDLEILSKHGSNPATFRTDRPLYPENARTSLLIRATQVLLLVPIGNSKKFNEALQAFGREVSEIGVKPEIEMYFSMVYMKAMLLPGLVDVAEDLSEFAIMAAKHAEKADFSTPEIELQTIGPVASIEGYIQFMFAFQLSRISCIQTLQRVMKGLLAKTKQQREFLLKAFETDHFEKSLVIKSSWIKLAEESESISESYAECYVALARELVEADEPEFAMAAFESAAVIWDEYLKRPDHAIAFLEEAVRRLGETQAAARALSRVFFHQGNYERQLEIGMPLSESFDGGSTETSFFFRELAMGNSHLGKHQTAKSLYIKAYDRTSADPLKGFTPMAAGLLADAGVEAYWESSRTEAVTLLARAMRAADMLDPDAGLRSAAAIRLIAHSVAWVSFQIRGITDAADVHVMAPGINSNPTPHQELEGRTEIPSDCIWYLLADTEATLDADCGVIEWLLSKDWDARAVLANEVTFYVSIALSAERRLLLEEYLLRMPRAIDARVYMEENANDLMEVDLRSSPRMRLQRLEPEKFAEHRGRFAKNVMSFALRLAVLKSASSAKEFVTKAQSLQRPLITKLMLDAFLEGVPSASSDETALAGTIGGVVKTMADGQPLVPADLMIVCLRLLELMENEFCEQNTVDKVAQWMLDQWKRAVVDQAFSLSSPSLAQLSLQQFELRANGRLGDIADLILAVKPFVRVNLGPSYVEWLGVLKNRKT